MYLCISQLYQNNMLELIIACLCIVICLAYSINWRLKNTSYFSKLGIPGPRPNLLFGNLLEIQRKGEIECFRQWVKQYGRVFGYYNGMNPILCVADPELLKTIFIRNFSKFVDREHFIAIKNVYTEHEKDLGIVHATGGKWKEMKNIISTTYAISKLKQITDIINTSLGPFLTAFSQKSTKNESCDIHAAYLDVAIEIFCKFSFGIILDQDTKHLVIELMKMAIIKKNDPFVFMGLTFPSLRHYFGKLRTIWILVINCGYHPMLRLEQSALHLLRRRRSAMNDTQRKDLLQILLECQVSCNGKNIKKQENNNEVPVDSADSKTGKSQNCTRSLEDCEIIRNCIEIFLAAFETVGASVTFATYLLAKSEDVQEKVFDEVKAVIGNDSEIGYHSLNNMYYLEQVLNEALRLFPPVHSFTNRYALEDVQFGELKIPKGLLVKAPTYFLHHDPEYWTNPEEFDPDRFNVKPNRNGITFFPYGIGPRSCIGMKSAQIETKLILAHVVYNFRFRLAHECTMDLSEIYQTRTLLPSSLNVLFEMREIHTKSKESRI